MTITFDIGRDAWVPLSGRAFSGPRGLMTLLDRWVIHYRGVPGVRVPANVLQSVANGHRAWMDDPRRGYALGYDEIVISHEGHELDGQMIEVRGVEYRGAATGGINTITWATCVWLHEDGVTRISPKAAARCRARSLELRTASPKISGPHRIFGHRTSESTTITPCPGDPLMADIADGTLWADDEEDEMRKYSNGILAIYKPEGQWVQGRSLAYFIRYTSGMLQHCTGPDFKSAFADPDESTHPPMVDIEGPEHYNQLAAQAAANGASPPAG